METQGVAGPEKNTNSHGVLLSCRDCAKALWIGSPWKPVANLTAGRYTLPTLYARKLNNFLEVIGHSGTKIQISGS